VNGLASGGAKANREACSQGMTTVLPSTDTTWAKQIDALDPYLGNSFTLHWRGVININADTFQKLLEYRGSSYGWQLLANSWSGTNLQLSFKAYWRSAGVLSSIVSVGNGSIRSITVNYDASTGKVEMFLDGGPILSPTAFTYDPGAITTGSTFYMQGDASSPYKMLTAQAFSGVLSTPERNAIVENPWRIFKAPARRLWAVSASGINLVGANSSEANTSGTAAITQDHALTGANSTQANTGATGAVTQAHALGGANSVQANTASVGAVTQGAQLTGANCFQANSSATGAVTQAHILAGSNSDQANAASTGAISQGGVFVGDNCAQGNAASTGGITQAHVLAAANSDQTNTASTGAISQGAVNDLTAANAAQANSGGTGTITQAHVLVHAPSVQDNLAAASAIVQAHVLAASNGSQGNVSSSASIIIGSAEITSVVEKTAVFRATVSRTTKFQRSKSVTVRLN
jgi:hypothetical protein